MEFFALSASSAVATAPSFIIDATNEAPGTPRAWGPRRLRL
ncbi:MAG: hypothetical protein Q8O67_12730 [Deltaproteobacteria bacterium]|nr:hypothetical protein [Deltaproteobacteria bacterium]